MSADHAGTEDGEPRGEAPGRVILSVGLFWVGYLAVTLGVGFVTSLFVPTELWRLIAWGFGSSLLLLALPRVLRRVDGGPASSASVVAPASSLAKFGVGLLIGAVSYAVHVWIVGTFAGPLRFEWVPETGVLIALVYFARFVGTSCMEEVGFRGYPLRRLTAIVGAGPAVAVTAVAFGLSHLSYGWDLSTIALGVVPGGLLWGMSALATRSLAVPIGLHAAWNFAGWSVGDRAETGLLEMIVDPDSAARTTQVGAASYLSIFFLMTLGFRLLYRRDRRRGPPSVSP